MAEKYYTEFKNDSSIEGSGGGGCFPAGSTVFTSHGWKPIERLRVGDMVVAFDIDGNLEHGLIVETFKHSKEENNSGLYTFTYKVSLEETKTLTATGNHAIFCGGELVENHFKEAKDFVVGEFFYDVNGNQCEIIQIDVAPIAEDAFTYNLEVHPQHTYVVDGIRVHNGGGGKKSKPPVEYANTLRSNNIARIMEVLSEGPIEGPVGGLKGVYFNGTVVQNPDNSYNFVLGDAQFRNGLPVQDYVQGWNGVETVMAVNTEVTAASPVVRELLAATDAAVIQIRLPNGLSRIDSSNGNIYGTKVTIAIDARPVLGVWQEVGSPTIDGKTMSTYDVSYRVQRPPTITSAWEVRVRRITADATSTYVADKTFLYQITQVDEIKLSYPDVAYAALAVDARSVGNAIPTRSYDIKGLICKIPSNYNPITRAYTGTWNGLFTSAWTDNPAWIVYDLLTNTRYGMGLYIDEATIDKWSFYEASVYNDELVNDGNGGTEPRFTFNQPIFVRTDAWKLIQTIASTMRAVVLPGGMIALQQDRPASPVKIVNNSNVKDGKFTYMSTGILARHTVVNVLYNDIDENYMPKVVTVEDTAGISRYGWNLAEITAYGTVTEGQARRAGKWFLDTEMNSTEGLSYETSFNQADLIPGDIIYVMDQDYIDKYLSGRIVTGDLSNVSLDGPVTLAAGSSYKINLIDLDGATILERNIVNAAGTYSTVTLDVALPNSAALLAGREWMITSSTDVVARQFRVLNVKEQEKGLFAVSAVAYDPTKYARIESSVVNPAPVYSRADLAKVTSVTNLTGLLEVRRDKNRGPIIDLRLMWDKSPSEGVTHYTVNWSYESQPFTDPIVAESNIYQIQDVQLGNYFVQVMAHNLRGVTSAPTYMIMEVSFDEVSLLNPPSAVTLTSPNGGTPLTAYGRDFKISWTPAVQTSLQEQLGGFLVKVKHTGTGTVLRESVVGPSVTELTYGYEENKLDCSLHLTSQYAARDLTFEVFALNTLRAKSSTSTNLVASNPAPEVPIIGTLWNGFDSFTADVYASAYRPDLAGIAVWADWGVADFTVAPDLMVFSGPLVNNNPPGSYDNIVLCPVLSGVGDPWKVKAAIYDTFSDIQNNPNFGASLNTTVATGPVYTNLDPTFAIPPVPTGLAYTFARTIQASGEETVSLICTWTANASNTTNYEIKLVDTSLAAGKTDTIMSANGTSHTIQSIKQNCTTYVLYIRGVNGPVRSAWSGAVVVANTGADAGPPSPCSLMTVTPTFKGNWLTWTNPTAADLAGIRVYAAEGAAGVALFSNATQVGYVAADNKGIAAGEFFHTGIGPGITYSYWLYAVDRTGNLSTLYPYFANGTSDKAGTTLKTQTADYGALSIVTAAIADAAIDSAKIVDASIITAKIANAAVDNAQIANAAISTAKIADAAITTAKIGDAQISTAKIGSAQVDSLQLVQGSVMDHKFVYNDVIGDGSTEWSTEGDAQFDNYQSTTFYSPSFSIPTPTGVNGPFLGIINAQLVHGVLQTVGGTTFYVSYAVRCTPQVFSGGVWVTDTLSSYPFYAGTVGNRMFEASDTYLYSTSTSTGVREHINTKLSYYFNFVKGGTYRFEWTVNNYNAFTYAGHYIDPNSVNWYGDASSSVLLVLR